MKILTARQNRRNLGIAMLVLQIFIESRSTGKCSGEVEAKSLEPDIQL